jgi:phage-related protein
MDIFDLTAKLSLNSSDYEKGLDNAGKKTNTFASSLGKGLKTAAKVGAAAVAAVTTAVIALTKGIIDGTQKVAAYGDNIDKASQKIGFSAKAYQEWDAVLQHSGTSIDALSRGMLTLDKAAASNSESFQKLGISEEEVASLSKEDLFAKVISGLQDMGEGAERTALAAELLGGSAKELGPLLNTSSEETQAMIDRVNELGGVMSDDAVKAAAKYQDSLQDFKTALAGVGRGIVTDFMPSVTSVMDGLTDIFSGDSEGGLKKLNEGITEFVNNLSAAIPKILPMVGGIVESLGKAILDNADVIIDAGVDLILQLLDGLVKGLPKLVKGAIKIIKSLANSLKENIGPLLKAFTYAIAEIAALFKDPEFTKEMIMIFVELAVAIAKAIIENLPSLIASIGDVLSGLLGGLWLAIQEIFAQIAPWFDKNVIQPVVNFFKGLGESIGKIFSDAWNGLKNGAKTAWDGIKNVFKAIPEWFKNVFKNAWEGVKNVFSTGGKIFDGIKDGIVSAFKTVVNAIITGINKVISVPFNTINGVLNKIREITIIGVSPFINLWENNPLAVPQIPTLARGGIVTSPTLAMIGESGKEAIVPLENNTEWTKKVAKEIASEINSRDAELAEISTTLKAILANMGVDIVLSDGVIAGRVDRILGQTTLRKARGNA